tara:strand:+ start:760 stop:993 length:234 start_codon:yes stop_codon:yes gene_type:complete
MSTSILKVYTGNDEVTNVDYFDIDYSSASFSKKPFITATAGSDDVSISVTLVTTSSARLQFSAKYTGRINYIVMSEA